MKKENKKGTGQDKAKSILSRWKKSICVFAAVLTAACFLGSCGPEPGPGESAGALFGEGQPLEESPKPEAQSSQSSVQPGVEAGNTAGSAGGNTAASVGAAGEMPDAAQNGVSGQGSDSALSAGIRGTVSKMDSGKLAELEAYLNEESSYGFLLSSYEQPQEIDLNQVFYAGAGFEQKGITEKERKLLLERMPVKEITMPVNKVREEDVEALLKQKTGLSHEEFLHPLGDLEEWAHIGRYNSWYTLNAETNRKQILCTDAWEQGDQVIVHYQLGKPVIHPLPEDPEEPSGTEKSGRAEKTTGTEKTAGTDKPSKTEKSSEAELSGAAETTAAYAGTAQTTADADMAAEIAGTAQTSADASMAAEIAGTADTIAEADIDEEKTTAFYRPFYEARLKKTTDGWQFCSNILWVQKDLIEAQSYLAELDDEGEVLFAPFFPDTAVSGNADVSFGLVRRHALLALLDPMEEGNIRTDLTFEGVDAVDFTDYNADGCQDILTVCRYTRTGSDSRRTNGIREARVYTGQKEGFPVLNLKKTEEVNKNVHTLDITDITQYLTGESDGSTKKYNSWKEAFADRIRHTDKNEYDGFALIYLNDDRVPELVQAGATSAKGATVVVYKNGSLQETWLNRRSFRYLEYENLLYSASGMENLHFDSFYSITGGQLGLSVQGYYGNKEFARVRYDEKGQEIYNYFWDGGEVSRSGYSDGIMFVFDLSRAKTCGEGENILTAEEMLEKLK
ncbi:MAG: hypothetical protein U0L10_14275 [Lachnospiraceae bacterium]|nr:hypothetical protein [Lachnospiraceae bacterium]